MRDRERETDRQREKQAPCRVPDVGLEPGTPGSGPGPKSRAEPKIDAQPTEPPSLSCFNS